jgi:uncharacterized protein
MNGGWMVFLAGLLFSLGLGLSGMTDPNKIIGFLDVSHGWDPSLLLVMVGAIGVHLPLYWWISRQQRPRFAERFERAPTAEITARLVGGAALFGAGWGLGGFCPGPGIVSLASGAMGAVVFVVGMTAGVVLFDRLGPDGSTPPSA